MKRRISILVVLAVGLIVSLPITLMAETHRTIVSGEADFADGIGRADGFRGWVDSGGRFHRNNVIAEGNFNLKGKRVKLKGKWSTLWSVVIIDAQNNGRIMGTFSVTADVDRQDTVVWEGHFIFEVINGFSSGFFWGTGSGPFEGKILEFNFDEDEAAATEDNPNPNIYLLNGVITESPMPQ